MNFGQMVWNNLELARDSLFIKKIKNAFKVTELHIVQEIYAIILENELLPTPLWQKLAEIFEIYKNLIQKIAVKQTVLNSLFILRINTEHYRHIDIRTVLKFLYGNPRKRHLKFGVSGSF